jgi:hypothetical protein
MRTISSALGGSGRRIGHRAELAELLVAAGRCVAQRADALGHGVDRVPQLGVLRHEHRVQRGEHRAGHVPVEVVGGQVQRVGVGQQLGQAASNGGSVFSLMPMLIAGAVTVPRGLAMVISWGWWKEKRKGYDRRLTPGSSQA